jgi:putative ABC transport system permease protein
MDIDQIIATLRHSKMGAILLALQIALTLAIVCNSLSIIQQRLARSQRITGIDEANIFVLDNQWVGENSDLRARIHADLAALRAIPGVVDAVAVQSYPLRGGESGWVFLRPEQKQPSTWTGYYMVDSHGLNTFGARLVEGRWFSADEIGSMEVGKPDAPQIAVVTRNLANTLFPDGDALGKQFYYVKFPMRIVGIVDSLQASVEPLSWGEKFVENSILAPMQLINNKLAFVVRTQGGQLETVMRAAPAALFAISRARVVDNVHPFAEVRAQAYHEARASSMIFGIVSALLLTVTALGIIGLTSYWVSQRRRQIGVRRALGASRGDILRYFHTENLLIAGTGAVLGMGTGLAINLWLADIMQLAPVSIGFLALGAVIVFVLSQAAVVWPALRAASVPPASAARGG